MYREPHEIEEYLVCWTASEIILSRFVGPDAKIRAQKWLKEVVRPKFPENFRVISIDTWILEGQK